MSLRKFKSHHFHYLGVNSELLYLVVLGLGHVPAGPVLGEHTEHLLLTQLAPLQAKDLTTMEHKYFRKIIFNHYPNLEAGVGQKGLGAGDDVGGLPLLVLVQFSVTELPAELGHHQAVRLPSVPPQCVGSKRLLTPENVPFDKFKIIPRELTYLGLGLVKFCSMISNCRKFPTMMKWL